MRKVERTAQPNCLRDNAQVWTQEFIAARQASSNYKFTWRSAPCYQALRDILTKMTQHHCAFCDGEIGSQSRETVEHFRPKSGKQGFPELAYQWENLFPCCDVCQQHKLEKFEEGLLKPDEETYRFESYFYCDYESGELKVNPRGSASDKFCAEIALKLYGLNESDRPHKRRIEREDYDLWKLHKPQNQPPIKKFDDFSYRYFLEDA